MPETSETFILGGRGTVAKTGREAFWANTFGKDLVNIQRLTHMNVTVDAWNHYRSQGELDEEVAVIVDGSVSRKITNVKLYGQIVIQDPAELTELYDAVWYTYQAWLDLAAGRRKDGDYYRNIHIFADNAATVDPSMFDPSNPYRSQITTQLGSGAQDTFFTIINTMPYAAKEERNAVPGGLAYGAWRQARGMYGSRLSLRFRYYTADSVDVGRNQYTDKSYKKTVVTTGRGPKAASPDARTREQYSKGKPLSFPAVNIAQPGAFNSGASPVYLKARRSIIKGKK